MTIAQRIINLRESNNLKQYELAEKLSMNPVVLNRIEKGSRPVRDEEIASIAKLFNVSSDYLLGIETPTTPTTCATASAPSLSPDETALLRNYQQLNAFGKKLAQKSLYNLTQDDECTTIIKEDTAT